MIILLILLAELVIIYKMSELTVKKISYGELKEKPIEVKDDRYGIASYFTETIRRTFLACPGYHSDDDVAVVLLMDGDIAIGREIRYGTRLKIGNEIVWVHTGCSMMVCEEYQKIGAGILLLTNNPNENDSVSFGALYTEARVKLLKKQKRIVFEIPQYTKIVNTRPAIESYLRLTGIPLSCLALLGNMFLNVMEIPNRLKIKRLKRKCSIKKETIVPEWAGEMATNDGHKYMEYHDSKWLQWNLDYNMIGYPEDIQSFFSVWDKKGKPIGFFMTKERFEEEAGIYRNIVRGTIVEWATVDKEKLSEADLNLLAISTFSPRVSNITTISDDPKTQKRFKSLYFRKNYVFQMSFKDKVGKYSDGVNMANWRIRYGMSNSILY